MIDIDARTVNR